MAADAAHEAGEDPYEEVAIQRRVFILEVILIEGFEFYLR